MGGMDLLVASGNRINGTWQVVTNLGDSINTTYDDMGPSLTSDGDTLYFFSDRDGGEGSNDIYKSIHNGVVWKTSENVGPIVNTPANERWPWISSDDFSLFFDSERSGGYGGFDLWETASIDNNFAVPDLYTNLSLVLGDTVWVIGDYTNPDDSLLVDSYLLYLRDEPMPPGSAVYLNGNQPPDSMWDGAMVWVKGVVDTQIIGEYWPGDSVLAVIDPLEYEMVLPPVTSLTFRSGPKADHFKSTVVDCDSCRFALMISGGIRPGSNYARYWDNLVKIYNYKTGSKGQVCPTNAYVLYYYGRGRNTSRSDADDIPSSQLRICSPSWLEHVETQLQLKMQECKNRGEEVSLNTFVTNHGASDGSICTLAPGVTENISKEDFRETHQTLINAGLDNLAVEMIQCYGGQVAEELQELDLSQSNCEVQVGSAAGPNECHYNRSDGSGSVWLDTKLDSLSACNSEEEAIEAANRAYEQWFRDTRLARITNRIVNILERRDVLIGKERLTRAERQELRRLNRALEEALDDQLEAERAAESSVHWRSFPTQEYCRYETIVGQPGGELVFEFSGDSNTHCTITLAEKGGWPVATWSGVRPGERRVYRIPESSSGVFEVHVNSWSVRRSRVQISSTLNPVFSYTSPSNPEDYASFSFGGRDGSSGEFGDIVAQHWSVTYGEGIGLAEVPRYLGEMGVVSLDVGFTVYNNPYWDDMELIFYVLDVIASGSLSVSCPGAQFSSQTIAIEGPGEYHCHLGAISEPGQQTLTISCPDAIIELDSWGVVTLIEFACDGEKGDPNFDFSINILDVVNAVNCILGTQECTECEEWRADCNGDGSLNVLDALGIVNEILGIGECVPVSGTMEITPEVMEFLKMLESRLSKESFEGLMK